ncbi:MAG: hypothetical protein OIN86_10610 [Candidatus Methanoperedens sp.]|nr:hypothetical protein [Candidatus Methanoperedens sp.]CAG0963532.1 hypothetical protein METP1_00846 [Methanosarcinales archaeon]
MNSEKIKNKCSDNENCEYNDFKRGKYFHGMLMTDRDFTEEQRYHVEKMKLHNRMLHGRGVVRGLGMRSNSDEKSIIIDPGLALDCSGNEIFVCRKYELDLSQIKKLYSSEEPVAECSHGDPTTPNKWYVVIRYYEKGTDQALVHASATSECAGNVCNASRVQEGFCLDVYKDGEICCHEKLSDSVNELCDTDSNIISNEEIKKYFCEELLYPDDCCRDSRVVLGSFILNKDTKKIDSIDNWDCRRFVMTFGLLQHWMRVMASNKIEFENIADYSFIGEACKSAEVAREKFCPEIEHTTYSMEAAKAISSKPYKEINKVISESGVKKGKSKIV